MPAERAPRMGTLYLVGTPIGNLSDITLRAIETLKQVSGVAAEDTRRTRALLSHLGISGKQLYTVNANTTAPRLERVIERLQQGADLAFVTDAGMPGVSDPGAELVKRASEAAIQVVCIPGPSAVTTAAALSGLVNGAFSFLGFLPRKGKKRESFINLIENAEHPVVLFESPVRCADTLHALALRMPERRAVLCRELTKLHEQVLRGSLIELSETQYPARGEVTLVVESRESGAATGLDGDELDREIAGMLQSGASTRDTVAKLGPCASLSRQELYARVQLIRARQADD